MDIFIFLVCQERSVLAMAINDTSRVSLYEVTYIVDHVEHAECLPAVSGADAVGKLLQRHQGERITVLNACEIPAPLVAEMSQTMRQIDRVAKMLAEVGSPREVFTAAGILFDATHQS
jgi:hypothetical protein